DQGLRQRMSVASRPVAAGKTRTCPHCKATILESLSICPGCLHHLRFDQDAAKRQVAATSALRVEGVIRHPPLQEPWEYFVVIASRRNRNPGVERDESSVMLNGQGEQVYVGQLPWAMDSRRVNDVRIQQADLIRPEFVDVFPARFGKTLHDGLDRQCVRIARV